MTLDNSFEYTYVYLMKKKSDTTNMNENMSYRPRVAYKLSYLSLAYLIKMLGLGFLKSLFYFYFFANLISDLVTD